MPPNAYVGMQGMLAEDSGSDLQQWHDYMFLCIYNDNNDDNNNHDINDNHNNDNDNNTYYYYYYYY